MKRLITLILVSALLICAMTSCNNSGYTGADVRGVSYTDDFEESATLIKSYDEFTSYIESLNDAVYEDVGDVYKYDESYFEDNMLVMIFLTSNSSSNKFSVKKVEYDCDSANVILKRKTQKIATDDMVAYIISVEIEGNGEIQNASFSVK